MSSDACNLTQNSVVGHSKSCFPCKMQNSGSGVVTEQAMEATTPQETYVGRITGKEAIKRGLIRLVLKGGSVDDEGKPYFMDPMMPMGPLYDHCAAALGIDPDLLFLFCRRKEVDFELSANEQGIVHGDVIVAFAEGGANVVFNKRSDEDVRCVTLRDIERSAKISKARVAADVPLGYLIDQWASVLGVPSAHVHFLHAQGKKEKEWLHRHDTLRSRRVRDGDSIHSFVMNFCPSSE